jgi:hypothetical protein
MLKHFGIRGKVNNWIERFLSGRTQAVSVEGEKSTYLPVDSGVPQGSVLGPSLFLYYMADFIECLGEVHNENISLFTIIQVSSHVVDELYKLSFTRSKLFQQFTTNTS